MPIYEYEPRDRTCFLCDGKIEVLQSISDQPLELCPYCGLEVNKLVSKAALKVAKYHGADQAAAKGFTTYRRAQKGVWEKIGGSEGADYLVGSKEDMDKIEAEKTPPKVLDLDQKD